MTGWRVSPKDRLFAMSSARGVLGVAFGTIVRPIVILSRAREPLRPSACEGSRRCPSGRNRSLKPNPRSGRKNHPPSARFPQQPAKIRLTTSRKYDIDIIKILSFRNAWPPPAPIVILSRARESLRPSACEGSRGSPSGRDRSLRRTWSLLPFGSRIPGEHYRTSSMVAHAPPKQFLVDVNPLIVCSSSPIMKGEYPGYPKVPNSLKLEGFRNRILSAFRPSGPYTIRECSSGRTTLK